ncbi:MAG TPA: Holliday junction branch migration protein RuvA [Bacteroidia bacterium]|nr:Holliday junction branch migration protein RuvA [Bacteroidia bacterium]HNS12763.1 Holliday junction branch migration protein RuvA [Bacteroidia bacterium]
MINHLRGKLIEKNPASIIVECSGVGYFVNISLNTYSKIGDREDVRILTHVQITEDAHTLFGFADEEERKLFRLLITVSGIGCNTARMMLSSMTVAEIETYILQEDATKLKSIKGIGEKTALRVILELKNKLRKDGHIPAANSPLRIKDEAVSALITLGFTKNSVDKTLDTLLKTSPSATVEDLIKQALKAL